MVVSARDYCVVEVTTSGGACGYAYGLSRGAPLDVVVTDTIAPLALGENALEPAQFVERCEQKLVAIGVEGLVQRAIALVEVALWDVRGKLENRPVWSLLVGGGSHETAPVLLVEGYHPEGETRSAFVERLALAARHGFCGLKLATHHDAAEMTSRLIETRAAVGGGIDIVVDAVFAWRDPARAVELLDSWRSVGLRWLEDPLPSREHRLIAALRAQTDTPIASGDDMTSRHTACDLLEARAIDVLRADAMALGGLGAFSHVRALAADRGIPLSPHVSPEIHVHCVFAWPDVGPLEMMGGHGSFDSTQVFLHSDALETMVDGRISRPSAPGLGLDVDLDAVARHSVRHASSEWQKATRS